MTLHQLKIFLAVAKYSSITRASRELHISEPSVYQQLKSLQMSLSPSLYKKIGRGIEITSDGRDFAEGAAEILRKAEELSSRFRVSRPSDGREYIVVGGSHVLSATILAPLLVSFKNKNPDVEVYFRTKSSPFIERLVMSGKIDIGLVTNATSSPQLIVEPFRHEEMVVVISKRHSLAGKRELSIAELARAPLIIRSRKQSSSQQILDEVQEQGFQLNIAMKCDSAQSVKVAVVQGLGLGLLNRIHVEQEVKAGELKIVDVPGLKKYIQSFIIYKAERSHSPAARKLLELLRQCRQTERSRKSQRWHVVVQLAQFFAMSSFQLGVFLDFT
jgi:DNA-binding transcriptional LysR family regulator